MLIEGGAGWEVGEYPQEQFQQETWESLQLKEYLHLHNYEYKHSKNKQIHGVSITVIFIISTEPSTESIEGDGECDAVECVIATTKKLFLFGLAVSVTNGFICIVWG